MPGPGVIGAAETSGASRASTVSQDQWLCPTVLVRGEIEPSLDDVERGLLCGSGGAWKDIPPSQAWFHFKPFLQSRGYFQPSYEFRGTSLWVDPGPRTRVHSVELEGAPADFPMARKRKVVGEILTPALLDQLELWSKQRLWAAGYACATVGSEADPLTGVIRLKIRDNGKRQILSILEESLGGLSPGMLSRYYAFPFQRSWPFPEEGRQYSGDELRLTEQRISANEILQSLHFSVHRCVDDDQVILRENAVAGAPRLLTFGFGANTEGLLLIRTSWKNTRVGKSGSSISFQALGSSKEQSLSLLADWYNLPYPTRRYLAPFLQFQHQNQTPFEVVTSKSRFSVASSADGIGKALRGRVGPSWDWIHTIRGPGPNYARLVSLETALELTTHYYELFLTSPRAGLRASFTGDYSAKGLVSNLSAQRLLLDSAGLWNFKNFDPPLWIFGFRTQLATTLTPERPATSTVLPVTFRRYLGGSKNIRGFGLNELPLGPLNSTGALTSLYLGLELRLGSLLPLGIEPLGFLDLATLSELPASIQAPLFWAPGLGGRWESPVGTIRGTVARGFAAGQPDASHFQVYLSLGEEF